MYSVSSHWIWLLPVLPAVKLVCDDFRTRRVGAIWLVMLFGTSFIVGWYTKGGLATGLQALCNTLLTCLLLGVLFLWLRFRHRQSFRQIVSYRFGAGDAAIMLATTPLCTPIAYVRLLLASCLSALVWWMLYRSKRRSTIPLAGFIAGVLICYVLCKFLGLWLL